MDFPTEVDYIVVGGGLTGCALASRLAKLLPKQQSILVLEAGPDPTSNPYTTSIMGGFALQGSELDWAYSTAPNPNLSNRVITLTAGKTLGGGSVLNYGGWQRGDAADYDDWAKLLDDERWSYNGLLPYMRRSEHYTTQTNPEQHGFDGPIKITGISESDPKRRYPLREPLKKAWEELGVDRVPSSVGKLAGLSEFLENWDQGIRQPAHLAYDLAHSGVDVRTDTPVHRVLFESIPGRAPRAIGVLLEDGRQIKAQEVVLAAGALRSPQILQLSGVGPASLLASHSIPLIHDSPAVGANLFDHFALFQIYRLRNPERGLALGHPALADPAFVKGMPVDWSVNEALPTSLLQQALAKDKDSSDVQGLSERLHVETMVVYHPLAPGIPVDGSYVGTSVMLLLPTSRGTVKIASALPKDRPVIDANYFDTAMDRAVLVHGVRRLLQCLTNTKAGQDVVEAEVAPMPGMQPLTLESTIEDIESRIRATGSPHFHTAGTCALGTVLDTELKVKGVQGLRVVDASVFPAPIGGHPQATLYGIAERAAAMIAGEKDELHIPEKV